MYNFNADLMGKRCHRRTSIIPHEGGLTQEFYVWQQRPTEKKKKVPSCHAKMIFCNGKASPQLEMISPIHVSRTGLIRLTNIGAVNSVVVV